MQGEPQWRNCNISKHKQVRSQNNHRTEGRYAASWEIWAIPAQAHVNPAEKIDECLNSPQLRREIGFGEISRVYRAGKAHLWRRQRTSIQQRRSTNVWTRLSCEGKSNLAKSAESTELVKLSSEGGIEHQSSKEDRRMYELVSTAKGIWNLRNQQQSTELVELSSKGGSEYQSSREDRRLSELASTTKQSLRAGRVQL